MKQDKTLESTLNYIVDTGERPRVYVAPPGQAATHTCQFDRHQVQIHDGRPQAACLSLDVEGLEFQPHQTEVSDFYDDAEVEAHYYPELERLLGDITGASKVVSLRP